MSKMPRMIGLIGAGAVLLSTFTACSLFPTHSDTRRTAVEELNQTWELEIPENCTEEYFIRSEFSFQNDGGRYYVFGFDAEPTEFLADFTTEREESFERRVDQYLSSLEIENDTVIPEDYRPDWEKEYLWAYKGRYFWDRIGEYSDHLYLAYFPETQNLCVTVFYL